MDLGENPHTNIWKINIWEARVCIRTSPRLHFAEKTMQIKPSAIHKSTATPIECHFTHLAGVGHAASCMDFQISQLNGTNVG